MSEMSIMSTCLILKDLSEDIWKSLMSTMSRIQTADDRLRNSRPLVEKRCLLFPRQNPNPQRCLSDLPPFFAHEIIRHFPTPGLRLRTAEPAKRSRTQPAPAM